MGAFTLFVSDAPYGYYTRPSSSHSGLMDAADLAALTEACRERDIDLAIEWVHEAHPGLGALAQGVETILLSAEDDDVARIYRQIGFHRVGTAGAVEKPET